MPGERKRCCPIPEDGALLLSQKDLPAGRAVPAAEIMAQLLYSMQAAVKGDRGTNPARSCVLSTVLISRDRWGGCRSTGKGESVVEWEGEKHSSSDHHCSPKLLGLDNHGERSRSIHVI